MYRKYFLVALFIVSQHVNAAKPLNQIEISNDRRERLVVPESATGPSSPMFEDDSLAVLLAESSASYRIMLAGNSITMGVGDGASGDNFVGFRRRLYQYLSGSFSGIDFVGKAGDAPIEGHFRGSMKIWDFYSGGLGGRARMDIGRDDCLDHPDYKPAMIAFHLGTNDLSSDEYAPVAPYWANGGFAGTKSGNLAKLINYALRWHNGTKGSFLQKIIVSQIIPIDEEFKRTVDFNIEIAIMVRDFQQGTITGNKEPVFLCDHFTPFIENYRWKTEYMSDNLHPNVTGYKVMANTYYQTMKPIISGTEKWFSNKTWDSGLYGFDSYFHFKGIAIADVTGDGRPDIYMTRTAPYSPNSRDGFYVNSASGYFNEKAFKFHINDDGQSHAALFVDTDNDGDFDLFNANSGGPNSLYDNLNNNDFKDVSAASNIRDFSRYTNSVLALDCENDGDMDIFAVNSIEENEFYVNRGDGRFDLRDRGLNDTVQQGIYSQSASAADFDNDGDVDIYVTKRFSPNRLFVNNGAGYFTDQAGQAGVALDHKCNGASWVDLDNDGDMDLVVTVGATNSDRDPLLRMYKNRGNGTFQDVSATAGVKINGYSAVFADYDNDGDLDVLTTAELQQGNFYQNNGDWRFQRVDNTGAEINAGDVRGAAALDYDDDGDVDVVAARADAFNVFLQNNLNNSNNYLKVLAYGPDGNIGGFGTKLFVYESGQLGSADGLLFFTEILSANGYISQPSTVQHIGVGQNNIVDILARFTDGTLVVYRDIPVNQTITIKPGVPSGESGEPAQLAYFSGDGQSKTVGEELDGPLVVKVTDELGRPVQGADVKFSVTDGDAQLFVREATGEAVWLEAENGRLGGFMQWVYDAGASGNGFVMVPDFFEPTGSDTLLAEIEAPGTFYLWLRLANSTPLSSLKVGIDGSPQQSISLDNQSSWQWVPAQDFSGTLLHYDLGPGTHTVLLTTTTPNLHIDRLLLTPDPTFVPTGLGGSSATPKLTDADGLALRFVQLGQTAGPVEVEAELFYSGQPVSGSPVRFNLNADPGAPVVFEKRGGDGQTGEIDVPLADPFVAGLYDAFDNAVFDFPVKFSVTSGGGTIDPQGTVRTNTQGLAQTLLTPGDASTLQQVKAEADGVPGSPLIFTATVQGVAHTMQFVSGDDQTATVKTFLPQPIKVKILTEEEEPVAGYPVLFTTASGNGVIYANEPGSVKPGARTGVQRDDETPDSTVQILTGTDGIAVAYWELGKKAGEHYVQMTADDLNGSPKQVKALALADKPAVVLNMGGDNQQAAIMSKLPDPFKVRINDQWGNPIEGQEVVFISQNGGGTFNGHSTITKETDAQGDAEATLTLGTLAGKDVYEVRTEAKYGNEHIAGSPAPYYATGLAGPAARLQKLSQETPQDTVNQQLPEPFRVEVTDTFDNPVADKEVTFEVTVGDGTLDGDSQKTVTTNNKGTARVFLKLGRQAGINQVRAFAAGLNPEQVFFTATGVPDNPDRLLYVSGSGQSAVINSRLGDPLRVKIVDKYENAVAGHLVSFQVKSEAGDLDGAKSVNLLTSENGEAEVFLTLGTDVGDSNHVVHATSRLNGSVLQGSPVVFYASSRRGAPSALIPITSGSGLLGAAHSELKEPLKVKILDARNLPYPNYPVSFHIKSGSGYFLPSGDSKIDVFTDEQGFASARWVLGNAGETHLAETKAKYENVHLENSPYTFKAIAIPTNASEMAAHSGIEQSGKVGEPLNGPIVVKITDIFNSPVGGHPVQFRVTKGGGYFENPADSMVVVNTNPEGLAGAVLTLGARVGEAAQQVTIYSYNQVGDPLIGAPVVVNIDAEPAAFDPEQSEIIAQSPIPATGDAKSIITVIPRDRLGNSLANRNIRLETSGLNATVSPMTGQTDKTGRFFAQASSQNAGQLTVSAIDITSGEEFSKPVQIEFMTSTARYLKSVQTTPPLGYRHSMLHPPLQVRVTDEDNAPVANYPVTFHVSTDSASILSPQPVTTDAEGVATVPVMLHDKTGLVFVSAEAPGLEGSPLSLPVNIVGPGTLLIDNVAGNNQSQPVKTQLPLPLQVNVHDGDDRPAGHITVEFTSLNNRIAYPDSGEVQTDATGNAQTTITLGDKAGFINIMATIKGTQQRTLFGVNVRPGEASKITLHSGDDQQGTAGDTLDMPLIVKIQDEWGNGVAGVQVVYEIQQGGGHFTGDSVAVSDAMGLAQIQLVLGPSAGQNTVFATAGDLQGSPVVFTATSGGATPAAMEIVGGDKQLGVAGHILNTPLQVKVLDELGMPVPEAPITFLPDEGDGRILPQSTAVSDSNGLVKVQWVLGANDGKQHVNVSYENMQDVPLRFEANAMPNSAPSINVPDSLVIAENQQIAFTVLASDAERDTIFLGARNLPRGASFDSTKSFGFKWRPDYAQHGIHVVRFYARDHVGAVTERDMKIRVLNVNRPPRILADECLPADRNLGDLKKPGHVDFVVVAEDDDDDRLNYLWTVNGEAKSTTSEFRLQSSLYSIGTVNVTAWVYDASDTAGISWNGDIISKVELLYFSGRFVPFQGIELAWETRSETDNQGFYVLKADKKQGPFVPVGHFVKSNPKGVYKITDNTPNSGETWFYRLEDLQTDGKRFTHDIIRVDPPLPEKYAVQQNHPNPFNPETTIRFEMPEPADIGLAVFDVLGRHVRTLVRDNKKPGYHVVKWDGCNNEGVPVAAGVYYYVLKTPDRRFVKKMVLVR